MGIKLKELSAAAMLSAGVIASAQAQQSDSDSDKIARVEVTANRRLAAEGAQDVPMAITVLQPETLAQFGLGNLDDIARLVPSMTVQQQGPGVNNITMRGLVVRGIVPSEVQDSSLVAVYIDDMPVTLKSANPDLKVLDLERVEILQGPQGTLYGAGSMAGTVRQITQKPDVSDLFGSVEAVGSETSGFGGFNRNLRGMINIPLKDDVLGLRLTAYTGEDSGYIQNVENGKVTNPTSTDQGRIAARLVASPDLTVDASITLSNIHGGLNDAYAGLPPYSTLALVQEKSDDDLRLYNLALNYNLGSAQLVSSTTYTDRNTLYLSSAQYPATAFIFSGKPPLMAASYTIANAVTDFAQELRLNSTAPGPLKWTGGAFFETGKRNFYENEPTVGFDQRFAATANFPGYNSQINDGAFEPNDFFSGTQNVNSHQIAVFAEATYTFFNQLDLTFGERLFKDTQDFNLHFSGLFGNLVDGTPTTPGTPEVSSSSETAKGANPRFAAAYHIDADHLLYADAGKGFRYGGNNQPVPFNFCGVNAPLTFGPDSLWSYEVGSKNSFLDDHMIINVDAYLINWNNVQVFDKLPCTYYFTQNAGHVRSEGLELQTVTKLAHNLTLGFNAAYNNAYAQNAVITGIAAQDIPAGSRTPYSPHLAGDVTVNYKVPVFASDEVGVALNYSYRSDAFTNFAASQGSYAEIPSSTMLNATVYFKTGKYELGLFGTNLNNGTKIEDVTTNSIAIEPGNTTYLARPRTIGLRLKASF